VLERGDIVFVDGSHRALMGSDVTVFFLEVLPRLPPGVVVHLHDIFLPYDYPASWARKCYSEQFLLAVLLLFAERRPTVLLPNAFIAHDGELLTIRDPLLARPELSRQRGDGGSFWFHL
jgi:hypothetical protein